MIRLFSACLTVTIAGCCSMYNGRLEERLDDLEKWRSVVDPEIYEIRRTSYDTLISMIYERDRIVTMNWNNIYYLSNRVDRIERTVLQGDDR